MGPKTLVKGESPEDAENWMRRMKVCFREFRCNEEQNMETLDFLVEGRAQRWWSSASAPIIVARGLVTWADLRTAFQKLYFSLALRQAKTSELLGLRQGSMSIDEYQLKFFELLPYCTHISDNTEAKYSLFLQGLNSEIHDRVTVGNDMTYEGLVSRCHQAEDNIRCNKVAARACYICGSVDHFKRDCPKRSGQSGQASRMGSRMQSEKNDGTQDDFDG
ncbi:uncharacterized protein [Henckelia pumila]|uniref:uncharacterized protein n=1 Tax=Henckelia pumila TaxID=405737 RepID=UPI003C6E19A6